MITCAEGTKLTMGRLREKDEEEGLGEERDEGREEKGR